MVEDGRSRLLERTVFEVIPMKNAAEKARDLPSGALVSVTASPAKGMMATVELCESLADDGYDVIPHISARLTQSFDELVTVVERVRDAGATRVLVIGGDVDEGPEFRDATEVLRALEKIDHPFRRIGVGAHPEGHPTIPDDVLQESLLEKQEYANYMATQMCFDPDNIRSWLTRSRAAGIHLPVVLGIPGAVDPARLLTVGARIGVGQSLRYLRKNASVVRNLLRPGTYSPDGLIDDIADLAVEGGVIGLHVYTFNQIESTVEWYEQAMA